MKAHFIKKSSITLLMLILFTMVSCLKEYFPHSEEIEKRDVILVTITEEEPSYDPDLIKKIKTELPYKKVVPNTKRSSENIEINCPKGYYLYCIPGQYIDAEERLITLQFVDQYVLTSKEVTEEKLINDIRNIFSVEGENAFNHYPGYILFSYNVFDQDFLPLECLYESVLKSSNEYRYLKDGFICELGISDWLKTSNGEEYFYICMNPYDPEEGNENNVCIEEKDWPVDDILKQLYEVSEGNGILYENEGGPAAYQQELMMYGERPLFRGYMASVYKKYKNGAGGRYIADPDCSIFNNEWWNLYQSALKALKEDEEAYEYPEIQIRFKRESLIKLEEAFEFYEKELESGWFQDNEKDLELRACIYANINIRDKTDLKNVFIFLKDLKNGHRLYYAGVYDPEEKTVRIVDKGADVVSGTNLSFLRDY